ncbi:MAG: hypothetical protein ACTTJE_00415 [Schwartzia sp. (in: firmicutes)]
MVSGLERVAIGLMALSMRLDALAIRRGLTLDAKWDESKHPRQPDGKFGSGAGKGKFDRKRKRPTLKLSKSEYARVMSELNTHLTKRERKERFLKKAIGNYLYSVENNGFDNYRILHRMKIY